MIGAPRIRKAECSDAATVKQIEVASGLSPWTQQDYAAECDREDSVFLIVENSFDGSVAGFLIMRLITHNNTPSGPTIYEFNLLNLAIDPKARRNKYASALLSDALRIIGETNKVRIYLEVRSSNSVALRFYDRSGFQKTGVRRSFYRNPVEDAVLMQLDR